MTHDPFGADGIRDRVLAAWAASPARFREDANAEEDLALGGYRDRLIVELAQNAADAASRAGVPGRLLLAVRELAGRAVLVAANTGAPLDADGVQALATLRASAKTDAEGALVGRFGVGFAAVLAVTDEPAVVCRGGGVRFAAADTRQLVVSAAETNPQLGEELTRRDGHVPVLRLPFPVEGTPPDGYDTAVLLPLRDAAAEDLTLRLLADVGDPLLLALPGLDELTIERPGLPTVTLRDARDRWHVLHRQGRLEPGLLADRPTEERGRDRWDVTWAVPRATTARAAEVVHAPTPTDEPLPWPALLIATFPLGPDRRHVAPGAATDSMVAHAADSFVELLIDRAEAGADVWPLLPHGLPSGTIDGALRAAVAERIPGAPILRSAEDPGLLVRPRDAVMLTPPAGADRTVVTSLAPWVAGLVRTPVGGPPPQVHGVRELGLADLVEAFPAVTDPLRWQEVYAALAHLAADPLAREAMAALPVPLVDGRVVRSARGLVLLTDDAGPAADALSVLGVRAVHPDASHPLLEQLGAVPAGARAVLELPAVRAAVERSGDEEADEDVADAVLGLVATAVAAGELAPGDLPWLGDLTLADDAGDPAPAATLALPGSDASRWFDPDEIAPVAPDLLEAWGADVLAATGVLAGLAAVRARDVSLDADAEPADQLEGWDDWCDRVADDLAAAGLEPAAATVPDLLAVRDLDVLRPEALPVAVAALAADPELRPAIVTPARVVAGNRAADVVPYTAWWLQERLDGPLAAGGVLADLLPPAPDWVRRLDPVARRSLGVIASIGDVDAGAVPGLLDRLADPGLTVEPHLLLALVRRLAELAEAGLEVDAPVAVRGIDPVGGGTRVATSRAAVVLEAPMFAQLAGQLFRDGAGVVLPAPPDLAPALADLLDLPLAGELAAGKVTEDGTDAGVRTAVPPAATALVPGGPEVWCEHERLIVDGADVAWWVDGSGRDATVHAATVDGLARGLAWAGGRWERRGVLAEVLADPAVLSALLLDEAFSGAAVAVVHVPDAQDA